MGLLENLFLVKRYPVFLIHLVGLLKLQSSIYSGLLACINRITSARLETNKSLIGALLETWIYSELLKAISITPERWRSSIIVTKIKLKYIFILENQEQKIIGIEVKASSTVFNQDFRGLRKLASLVSSHWASGIVLYDGDQCLHLGTIYGLFRFRRLAKINYIALS